MGSVERVATGEFKHIFENGSPLVVDVRTAKEFRSFHLEGVLNLPLAELSSAAVSETLGTAKTQNKKVYILCHSGKRAETAAKILADGGIKSCLVVKGGTVACEGFGMNILHGGNKPTFWERYRGVAASVLLIVGVILWVILTRDF